MPMAAVAAATVASAAISANSASKASKAQEAGANKSDATQRYMYNTTRADNKPLLDARNSSLNALMYGLGLGGSANGGGAPTIKSAEDFRNELKGSYSTPGNWADVELARRDKAAITDWLNTASDDGRGDWNDSWNIYYGGQRPTSLAYGNSPRRLLDNFQSPDAIEGMVDEVGLNRAVEQRLAQQQADLDARGSDPNYGDLSRDFTVNDFYNDPVTKLSLDFGLSEGTKNVNRMFAAQGGRDSGAVLKALQRFTTNTVGQTANDSRNRFTNTRDRKFNMLSGVAGLGQVGANQVAAAGQNYANNVSNTAIGLGNARGASAIAAGNGINNALSQGYNMYQQNQMMNNLFPQQPAGFGYAGMNGFGDSYSTSYGE